MACSANVGSKMSTKVPAYKGLMIEQRKSFEKFADRFVDVFAVFSNATALSALLVLRYETILNEDQLEKIRLRWKELKDVTGSEGGTLGKALKSLIKKGMVEQAENGKYFITGWGITVADLVVGISRDVNNDPNAPPELKDVTEVLVRVFEREQQERKKLMATINSSIPVVR